MVLMLVVAMCLVSTAGRLWARHAVPEHAALVSADPPEEMTPALHRAVGCGLRFLAGRQREDGSYAAIGSQGHVGITSLAGLAFMSGGSLPERGPYAAQVRRSLQYVLSCARPCGLLVSDGTFGPMYSHALATLFLGEAWGMTHDTSVCLPLQRAVRLLEASQSAEGGWRYQPVPFDADISVTAVCVAGLRSARDAGIKVDHRVIERALGYVRRCQNPDGGFAYMPGGSESAFARSAAGVASFYYAGQPDDAALPRGLRYLSSLRTGLQDPGMPHFFYGHYYACQAFFMAGSADWQEYWPLVRELLIRQQDRATGAWNDLIGPDYATAMALLILQMPNRFLPIYHGKGPGA